MYEVGTAVEVRAQHVMPGVPGHDDMHSHDYRIEVNAKRAQLDDRGMVCDLDVLDAALASIADHVRDQDLDKIRPPGAEAVTVEVFARWAHGALAAALRDAGGGGEGVALAVRVWESPTAYGGYRASIDS